MMEDGIMHAILLVAENERDRSGSHEVCQRRIEREPAAIAHSIVDSKGDIFEAELMGPNLFGEGWAGGERPGWRWLAQVRSPKPPSIAVILEKSLTGRAIWGWGVRSL
jgi:hypothetical protein